jgi:hypothetical protein
MNGDKVIERMAALAGNGGDAANAVFFDADSQIILTRLPSAMQRRIESELGDVLEAASADPR